MQVISPDIQKRSKDGNNLHSFIAKAILEVHNP